MTNGNKYKLTTNQPDTNSNPNLNPTSKHHAVQCSKPSVPHLGVNYPYWAMGFLIWEIGCFFFISVLTTTHFIEHKLARLKQAQPSH